MTSIPTDLPSAGHAEGSSLDLLPMAVLVLDADLRAVEVNGGWEQLCGRTPHDSRGTLWWRSIDHRDRAALRRALSSPAPVEGQQDEHRVLAPDGTRWTRWWWQRRGAQTWVCIADVDAARSRAHELWQRATHDPLTGLANRTEFMALLERALGRAVEHPALTVVFIDLDHFKEVNDTSGHRAGDAVLAAVAQALVEAVRPFDVAARIGGDEFAVLCPALTTREEAAALAARIRTAVASSEAATGIAIRASAGAAVSLPEDTPDSLMVRADRAMYDDKAARRTGRTPPQTDGGAVVDLRRPAGGPSLRAALDGLRSAITDAEEAVRREWEQAEAPDPLDEDVAMRLVRTSRLLRAAERALEPDVLG